MKWNEVDDPHSDGEGHGKWTRKEKLSRAGLTAVSTSSRKPVRRTGTATTPWLAESGVEPTAGHRHDRLQRLMQEELQGIIRDEVRNPLIAEVTVRSVELSVDYRTARVRFDVPADEAEPTEALRALEKAEPFLRSRLIETLEIKRVPLLRFTYEPIVSHS